MRNTFYISIIVQENLWDFLKSHQDAKCLFNNMWEKKAKAVNNSPHMRENISPCFISDKIGLKVWIALGVDA